MARFTVAQQQDVGGKWSWPIVDNDILMGPNQPFIVQVVTSSPATAQSIANTLNSTRGSGLSEIRQYLHPPQGPDPTLGLTEEPLPTNVGGEPGRSSTFPAAGPQRFRVELITDVNGSRLAIADTAILDGSGNPFLCQVFTDSAQAIFYAELMSIQRPNAFGEVRVHIHPLPADQNSGPGPGPN